LVSTEKPSPFSRLQPAIIFPPVLLFQHLSNYSLLLLLSSSSSSSCLISTSFFTSSFRLLYVKYFVQILSKFFVEREFRGRTLLKSAGNHLCLTFILNTSLPLLYWFYCSPFLHFSFRTLHADKSQISAGSFPKLDPLFTN
jgi:hypothetical protein